MPTCLFSIQLHIMSLDKAEFLKILAFLSFQINQIIAKEINFGSSKPQPLKGHNLQVALLSPAGLPYLCSDGFPIPTVQAVGMKGGD